MQNIIHLLALIRVHAPRDSSLTAHAIDAYASWVAQNQAYLIDVEVPQLMACLPNAGQALASLHALMCEGDRYGFEVAIGLVQAIRATDRIPKRAADFTERTVQTVVELAGGAGPQQICASPKLLSLLQLAVPEYAVWFRPSDPAQADPLTRVRQPLLLSGRRLPVYRGAIRILAS